MTVLGRKRTPARRGGAPVPLPAAATPGRAKLLAARAAAARQAERLHAELGGARRDGRKSARFLAAAYVYLAACAGVARTGPPAWEAGQEQLLFTVLSSVPLPPAEYEQAAIGFLLGEGAAGVAPLTSKTAAFLMAQKRLQQQRAPPAGPGRPPRARGPRPAALKRRHGK